VEHPANISLFQQFGKQPDTAAAVAPAQTGARHLAEGEKNEYNSSIMSTTSRAARQAPSGCAEAP
jgi:hypothetical protein